MTKILPVGKAEFFVRQYIYLSRTDVTTLLPVPLVAQSAVVSALTGSVKVALYKPVVTLHLLFCYKRLPWLPVMKN